MVVWTSVKAQHLKTEIAGLFRNNQGVCLVKVSYQILKRSQGLQVYGDQRFEHRSSMSEWQLGQSKDGEKQGHQEVTNKFSTKDGETSCVSKSRCDRHKPVGQVCVLKTEVREQVKMSERFKHNHVATGVKNKVLMYSKISASRIQSLAQSNP
ncbi:predicted protein [Arabidopsis lyrata subsp. lyrata]|uniref:Predicted protein n=1 Tax=Arabidopsis lyrata subsp. lyrata TaxID=81972 RepID=D7LEM4_ARALL|nr:predicted protein [Arabidopsis lyrata subsp. lyrata]